MEEQQDIHKEPQKRPVMLTWLCILTFIGSGLGVAGFLAASVNYEQTMEVFRVLYADMPEASFLLDAPRGFFIISLLLSAFSVIGALFMWNLRKTGFHIYTSAQLINLIIPMIYFGGETNPMLNIAVTVLFVYLYARNLRYMH
jgi:hypothetical protein